MVVSRAKDGLWNARGDVIDLRKCGFVPLFSDLQPAGIIHQMTIDLVVDPATRRIESIETEQPFVAIEPSAKTGGECCRDPAPRLQALAGERLGESFAKRLSEIFGGPRGCSHLLTLFQLMASGLSVAVDREEDRLQSGDSGLAAGERIFWRSCFVDGHEGSDGSFELTVQLHDFHATPRSGVHAPMDRFDRHDEVRLSVRVEQPSFLIREVRAAERTRESATISESEWRDVSDRLAPLVDVLVVPGLARRVFGLLGDDPRAARLRDALLQLAPGQIQIIAAVTDRWFTQVSSDDGEEAAPRRDGPPVGAIGGNTDSCYMWRRDGVLGVLRESATQAPGGEDSQ